MSIKSIVHILIAGFMFLTLTGCGSNEIDQQWVTEPTYVTFQEGNDGVFGATKEMREFANRATSYAKKWMDETGFIGGIFVAVVSYVIWAFVSIGMILTNAFFSFSILGVVGATWDSICFFVKMFFAIFGFHF